MSTWVGWIHEEVRIIAQSVYAYDEHSVVVFLLHGKACMVCHRIIHTREQAITGRNCGGRDCEAESSDEYMRGYVCTHCARMMKIAGELC